MQQYKQNKLKHNQSIELPTLLQTSLLSHSFNQQLCESVMFSCVSHFYILMLTHPLPTHNRKVASLPVSVKIFNTYMYKYRILIE